MKKGEQEYETYFKNNSLRYGTGSGIEVRIRTRRRSVGFLIKICMSKNIFLLLSYLMNVLGLEF